MDVRIGDRVICTVVVDFVPATMRDKLAKLKGAASGEIEAADVWAEVELIPRPRPKAGREQRHIQGHHAGR